MVFFTAECLKKITQKMKSHGKERSSRRPCGSKTGILFKQNGHWGPLLEIDRYYIWSYVNINSTFINHSTILSILQSVCHQNLLYFPRVHPDEFWCWVFCDVWTMRFRVGGSTVYYYFFQIQTLLTYSTTSHLAQIPLFLLYSLYPGCCVLLYVHLLL